MCLYFPCITCVYSSPCYPSIIAFTGGSQSPKAPLKRARKVTLEMNKEGRLADKRVTQQREKDRAAARKIKSIADPKKKGNNKRSNYKEDVDLISYSSMRQEDWFEGQDREVGLRNFWCMEQKYVYDDIYMTLGHPV